VVGRLASPRGTNVLVTVFDEPKTPPKRFVFGLVVLPMGNPYGVVRVKGWHVAMFTRLTKDL
jgi:hypothetical protein